MGLEVDGDSLLVAPGVFFLGGAPTMGKVANDWA